MKAKNISFVAVAGITAVAFSAFAISSLSNSKNEYIKNVASDTITLNVTSMTSTSLTLSNGYTVPIVSDGFTDGDASNLCSISAGGYFRLSDFEDHIRGIHNISVTTTGCYVQIVRCVYDYQNDVVITDNNGWGDAAQNPTADYSLAPIDFFEIYVSGGSGSSWIKSISVELDKNCSTSLYTFSAEFVPDWSGKTADNPADIYIVGTSELIDGTTSDDWPHAKMTYDSVSGKYSFSRDVNPGYYEYSFYAVAKGESFSWTNHCVEGDQSITINDDFSDTTTYSWSKEPGYVSPTSWSITFNLTFTDSSNASGAGLMYREGSEWVFDGTYVSNLTYVSGYTYSYTFESDVSEFYFGFKTWGSSWTNSRIETSTAWAGWSLTIDDLDTSTAEVNVTVADVNAGSTGYVGTIVSTTNCTVA